ncbi:type I restriction endonuclease subunit R [Marinigracilibium pacificum]|uniref:Type I restriction enzyme endonuclease subunit n=1 Tax=Marinigracilibium pacificum TaxID=2729599 RepID=A0A848J4Q6_9BACT|nr:type I restriction endonuclease subunit R [Marinigracilibium pacificum]NMM50751.1 type I restriction endonuclease subunit R [Marinigracilibium pacificum]
MSKYTEATLEDTFITLLQEQGFDYIHGDKLREEFATKNPVAKYGHLASDEVIIRPDLESYLTKQYPDITPTEIDRLILELENLPASDLYDSNKQIMKKVCDGFVFKRDDHHDKDLYIELIDYSDIDNNTFRVVNQLAIDDKEFRIPDVIVYINGLPLVVFELKSATREEPRIFEAWDQLTNRYRRDIPELFKYNAFCVISDGVNTKAGSYFAPYEFFYSWRKVTGDESTEYEGIDSTYSLIQGMFNKERLLDIIHHFIFFPDSSHKEAKILCRYPQYYASKKLFENIKVHLKPEGDGKGGTYFGATGCGKSFTMLFLTRLLMRSTYFSSPTVVLITDRTDLDDQLSEQFEGAKSYVGDNFIKSVESRQHLRELLQGRNSGGVFLTTIHKFTEDTQLLSDRENIICISDEAHRSQTNLDQKVTVTDKGVRKSYGFAKYLHDSLPNATYVGFTGTPVDATLDVFGPIVDAYTMQESVADEITVRIVYEGRAAKVILDNEKLQEVEKYYKKAEEAGANEYQIEESKRATAKMNAIIGDKDRLKAVAEDFIAHYEERVSEGATVKGKAMFVCSSREIAYDLYQMITEIRPEWAEVKTAEEGAELTEKERKSIKPIARVNMVMTRTRDDKNGLYELLGNKDYRKELDRQFKEPKSNFKIAIVVDMWLTGFDVPFLDTLYLDKPLQKHTLIQTISRVNRKFEGKDKGLVVDYFGIKRQMNQALAMYSKEDAQNFEDIKQSIVVTRDMLSVLASMFHKFDSNAYFNGNPKKQLDCLKSGMEFVQQTRSHEKRFMDLVKRLKAAYDICCGSEEIKDSERDQIHFYFAIRSLLVKYTKGEAPDTAQMNKKVRIMIEDAIKSDGVEVIFKLGEDKESQVDIFNQDYMDIIDKIKRPNTKIAMLQQLLKKAIGELKKTNRAQGIDFSRKFQSLVDLYNERKESDTLEGKVYDEMADALTNMVMEMQAIYTSGNELGISFEEKAFYDILKELAYKYHFQYPEEKLIPLSKAVKDVVDDKAKYTDWSKRDDIKAELKVDLILLLGEYDYPPVDRDEVYHEIFEQAENYKKYRG